MTGYDTAALRQAPACGVCYNLYLRNRENGVRETRASRRSIAEAISA